MRVPTSIKPTIQNGFNPKINKSKGRTVQFPKKFQIWFQEPLLSFIQDTKELKEEFTSLQIVLMRSCYNQTQDYQARSIDEL